MTPADLFALGASMARTQAAQLAVTANEAARVTPGEPTDLVHLLEAVRLECERIERLTRKGRTLGINATVDSYASGYEDGVPFAAVDCTSVTVKVFRAADTFDAICEGIRDRLIEAELSIKAANKRE